MKISINTGKKSKKPIWKWLLIIGSILIMLVALVFFAANMWQQKNLRPLTSQSQIIKVSIPSGSSAPEIGEILEKADVIRSALAFTTYVKTKEYESSLKAGTYELDSSWSVQDLVEVLVGGKEAANLFTIAPGLRLDQIRKKFIESGFSSTEVDAGLNASLYRNHPALASKPKDATLEGYLYPESFQITESTTVNQIIEQSLDEMAKRLTPERLEAFAAQGLTAHQAIIIASIIEREVPQPDDRRIVAQIFLKRLREGIPLGADATYVYAGAITGQEGYPELDSPYNTRKYPGLPPGPISNVTESALDAVAYPASTSYLFFVSGDDGKNYWAYTQEEHDQNIKNYCQLNCR